MKSIWIPLALCASIAPMPTAFAAQNGQTDKPANIEQAKRDLADAQANLKALLEEQKNKKVEWTTIFEADAEVTQELETSPQRGLFWSYGTEEVPTVKSEAKVERFVLSGEDLPTGHRDKAEGGSRMGVLRQDVWIDEDGHKGKANPVMPHDFPGGEDFDFSDIEEIINAYGGQGTMRIEVRGENGRAPRSFARSFRLEGEDRHETQGTKWDDSKQEQAWITIMGNDDEVHHQRPRMGDRGKAQRFRAPLRRHMGGQGGNAGPENGRPRAKGQDMPFDGYEVEVFFSAEAMPEGVSFYGGKKGAPSKKMQHEKVMVELAEIADCEAAPNCCDCECGTSESEDDFKGQTQDSPKDSPCEDPVAYEEASVCDELESDDAFLWATDAEDVDIQIEALVNELGGDHAQAEVRVIHLADVETATDFDDIDALIAELEGDLATTKLEALLADLESDVVTLEIDAAKVETSPVVVAPAKPAVDAKVAALEAKVADLEAIIESLVKELNQR
ncbi:MAG: hypothetical protein P8R48_10290 [Planctomycetota bacterium]|nr:hypothetical protein [Planctomycetota bacterium]